MERPDIGELMDYEEGNLTLDETIDLFQRIYNCGMHYSLQGFYGRTLATLIERGLVKTRTADAVQH
jgi:hypothetical protein